MPAVVELSVNRSEVTGSVTLGQSPTVSISDGKLNGQSVTFKTITVVNGNETPVFWEGDVMDDQLTLVRSFGTGGRKLPPLVLRRSQ